MVHSHELVIDKTSGKAALERLDFTPLDNKFHRPLPWDAFLKASEEQADRANSAKLSIVNDDINCHVVKN